MTEVDGQLIVSKVVKTFNKLKNLVSAKGDKEYKFDVGIVDIETYNINIEGGVLKAVPYAIGLYYNGVFKSFYITDYSETLLIAPTLYCWAPLVLPLFVFRIFGKRLYRLIPSSDNFLKDCLRYM
jgi:hypothetical protein